MDAAIKRRRAKGETSIQEDIADLPMVDGRRLDELTSEELFGYHGGDGPRPRVIKPKKRED